MAMVDVDNISLSISGLAAYVVWLGRTVGRSVGRSPGAVNHSSNEPDTL